MANDPMLSSASAFLNELIKNESDSDDDIVQVQSCNTPNDPRVETSSMNSYKSQQSTIINSVNDSKNKIVISNLREPYGNDASREAADLCTIQQILFAIDASTAAENVKKVSRNGIYDPKKKPRQITVCFVTADDQKIVLANAGRLKDFDEWKNISLEIYRNPQHNDALPFTNQIDHEKEDLKQQVIEMTKRMELQQKQMDLLLQMQKEQIQQQKQQQQDIANKPASIPPTPQETPPPVVQNPMQNHSSARSQLNATPFPSNMSSNTQNMPPPDQQMFFSANQIDSSPNIPAAVSQPPPSSFIGNPTMLQQFHQQQQNQQNPSHPFQAASLNGSYMNQQNGNNNMPQMPLQMPSFGNMPYDMVSLMMPMMMQMMQQFSAAQNTPPPLPTQQPIVEHQVSTESEESPEEESEEEEEEEQTGSQTIHNELFKSQSERHVGTKKTLNILVLGETGVGKSTWINGIANYMSFDTLEDALNAPQPICLIASKFAFYETNEDKIEVKLEPSHGEKDQNEAFSDQGQSSTQEPKTYQFETSKYIVNIIDTPGIGDTRGIEQDKENTRKILNAIGQYKDLHAICFLFKANEARMTLSFRYCISELLLQLHKDAVENIIFFFTNARGTFYKPGDTMTPLSQFLTELQEERGLRISLASDKICCTDNEAFRLVCAYFNGAKFTQEDFLNFAGSWKQSAAETHRFIEFAARQRPHHVADTVSINKARTIILHLAKPLADVNELIESNIKVFDDRKNDLQNTAANLVDLKKKLKISQIGIEVKKLDYPKTVCTGTECIETQKLPNTEQLQVIYKQICHAHCGLNNVTVEVVPEPQLVNCAAMAGQNCRVCKCHWMTHMHIRFDQIKTTVDVEDKNTKVLIQKNEDAAKVKEKMIKDCEKTIDELKAEQQKIIKTSLRFGSFLQANAILPYNDAFEKYVEQTITEEEKCTEVGGDRSKLDNLKKLLNEYRQEKTLLSEALKNPQNNANTPITPDEIDVMKAELFGLKNTGKTLKNLFEATEDGIATNNAHVTVKYTPARKPQQIAFYGSSSSRSNNNQKHENSKKNDKNSKNKSNNKNANKNKNKGNIKKGKK